MKKLTDLDDYLDTIRANMDGPLPIFVHRGDQAMSKLLSGMDNPKDLTTLALFNYAYGSWRTAVLLSITGNTNQIAPILRVAIEALLYAHLFKNNQKWRDIWQSRHKSKSQASKFRKDGNRTAQESLESYSTDLLSTYSRLYEGFVNFGAHPNPAAVDMSTSFQVEEGADSGIAFFWQLSGERERYFVSVWLGEVCNFMLEMSKAIWPVRYDLLGIEASRRELLKQLLMFINNGRRHLKRD